MKIMSAFIPSSGRSESVSTVPGRVDIEAMVRAQTPAAVPDAAATRRAYHAGALAVGAKVVIESLPGYLPLHDCRAMADVFKKNKPACSGAGAGEYNALPHRSSSTERAM